MDRPAEMILTAAETRKPTDVAEATRQLQRGALSTKIGGSHRVRRERDRQSMQTYEGGCHCKSVRFRVMGHLSDVSECNCSICTKKGFLHLIVPRDRFELLSGRDNLTTYEFNTKVAKHIFCKTCGIHAFYVPRSDPDKIDVNVRCLNGIDLTTIKPRRFDGRNWEEAMAARSP
jgi:hypothetical protein